MSFPVSKNPPTVLLSTITLSAAKLTRHNVIKSISINRAPAEVLEILTDPKQLPKWLFFSITAVRPVVSSRGWEIKASGQTGTLRISPLMDNQGVDYEIQLPDQKWHIPFRIVPNEDGAIILLPLIHGKNLTNYQFSSRVASSVRELGLLKRLLES